MRKILLVLVAITVLSSHGFAWYNDTSLNDSGLTIESDFETYVISRENPVVSGRIKVTNPGHEFEGTVAIFFQDKHHQTIKVKPFKQGKDELTSKKKNISYARERFSSLLQKTVVIPSGESFLDFEFDVEIETPNDLQGEFVFRIENNSNPLQQSTLDPNWDVGEYLTLDPYAVALYHCNEVAGTNVEDAIGAFDATATNALIWDASGKWNGGCGMDTSYYFSQDTLMDTNHAAWTFEMWIKPIVVYNPATGATWSLWGKKMSAANKFYGYLQSGTGKLRVEWITDGGADHGLLSTTNTWNESQWYHIAVEYDGTGNALYIDGVKEANNATAVNLSSGTNTDFYVGANIAGGEIANLVIDEIALSNIDRNGTPWIFFKPPDVNLDSVEGYSFEGPLPGFDYLGDENLAIDFNVFDSNNDRLFADINYSETDVQGTGTPIFTDLNLTSEVCTDQDWDDSPSECSFDWNIIGVTDANYFILINLKNNQSSFFNKSSKSFGINNDVNLTVLLPIDEESKTTIDTDVYSFSISIQYGDTLKTFDGMTDQNSFMVPKGTADYIVVEVDTNTTDYFSRRYSFQFDANDTSETLQPYLVKTAVAGENGFQSILFTRTKANVAIPDVRIVSRKVVPDLGLVKIEEMVTDVAGSVTFSFVSNDTYFLNFYRGDETVWQSAELRPVYSEYQFYIEEREYNVPDTNVTVLEVSFFPEGTQIDANVVVDLNVDANVFGCVVEDLNVRVYFDNNVLYDHNFEAGHYDLPMLSVVGAPGWTVLGVEVYLECASGVTISKKHGYTVNPSTQQSMLYTMLTSTLPNEMNPFQEHKEFTTLIAIAITILVVGAIQSKARVDFAGTAIFAMLVMGLFTAIEWVMPELFIAACVITGALVIVSRGGL